ncbi:ABC-F family ATP-binding cassette domain-containing protein [Clostridium formicaceticum]|uniref:ABC transporter ATP-binding protein YheS n=1 Tax=Clostridium formicaceticum TaxID=1497 RepID=A0AAC9RG02_9CLOT|nr:ABC-F family ATP-binding cassette domain-containing protein [Clostridium formicaceticum]AOY75737.1 thiamine ABC transporter substrate-binding protein [Clostridium formicaceticum]ARE86059.1 putative ABC transporter ATP-binding protein YheS [Clostridium formicaceticum]
MIVLSCNNISKFFGVDVIIRNITFSINKGEKVALVGINGAGKSTLFKILCQQLPYDDGELYIAKSTRVGYLEQNNILNPPHTVYEEVMTVFSDLVEMEEKLRTLEHKIAELGNNPSQALDTHMQQYAIMLDEFNQRNGYGFRSEVRGVLRGLGFTEEEFQQPVLQLSGGQKTRVSLAKLLLSKPDVLMLDEPTNHLDIEAVEWLEGFLKDYPGTILIISHDRYFLDQLVNRVMEIENCQLESYNGNYTAFTKKKQIIREQQLKEYTEQQKEITRQKDIIRRLRQHGTEKLINRAKSKEKQLTKIEEILPPPSQRGKAKMQFHAAIQSGNDILHVENLSKSFGDTVLFQDISFDIYRGERVALIGANGVGKSTLFKILLNKLHATAGNFRLGHNVHMGYYDQEQEGLHPNKSIIDEIWNDHIYMDQTEVRTLLGSFLFQGEDVFKIISTLSGGEKARLSLLKLILSKANLLLLDEPTNHLDIDSKEVLEEALLQYDGTIFVISHDRYFLNRVATRIIDLSCSGVEVFLGNYDYYVEKKKEQFTEEEDIQTKTKTQLKEERRKEKEERDRIRQLSKKREKIEEEIMTLEEKLSQLEAFMCQEEVYSNPDKSKEVHQETVKIKEKINELYEMWEVEEA